MLAAFAYFSRCWCFCVRLKTIAYENIVQIFCSILRCCGYDSFFSSCSMDSVKEKKLVGKWKSESYKYYEYDKDGNVVYEESEYYTGDDYYVFDFNEDGSGFMITSDEGDMDSTPCTWVLVEGKLTVTVKIGSYSDNMTFALESVSATKSVLVDLEVESDGTSWKEEYVFKKLFWPEPWVARPELPRNDLKTDPKQ